MPDAPPRTQDVWVILPTYNEAENLEQIVGAVLEHLPPSRKVLIVDDNSPDGTGKIADRLAASDESIEVLHRERKEGLGPAYLAGFRVALDGGAERIIEMDADFSHDPSYLPRLIGATEHADLAIGSRYVPGGGITEWGPVRRLISRGGSAYARAALGLPVHDLTGGFKCFRRIVLESINLETIEARGYAFQVETTY
ncbi:MAG: polyprenol monophosphomannose synthase, partial [Solirubrobacterales bacterium]